MTTALEHIRYSCGIAGEEVANYVDELERVVSSDSSLIDELRAQLTAAQEEIERLKVDVEFWESYSKAKLGDQLTKAEQRVAEACALTYLEDYDLTDIADRVRDGEWRKFVKEV